MHCVALEKAADALTMRVTAQPEQTGQETPGFSLSTRLELKHFAALTSTWAENWNHRRTHPVT